LPLEHPEPVPKGLPVTAGNAARLGGVTDIGDFTVRDAVSWLAGSVARVDAGVEAFPVSRTVICGV